jgi:two-component system, chemotaxis family, protein-glutamate methylesterase/glutaminase
MPVERVIVVGTSSGGLDALRVLVAGLPADLATPICVVQHIGPSAPGILHKILAAAGRVRVPVSKATSGMPLRGPGIYVAPPDFHLIVEKGMLRTSKGPRENRFRPAIDPLFRSAASSYGPGAIGVVLTGDLDDGTSGLWAIKDRGGVAIAQDPVEAPYPSMPRSAIQHVAVDHVVPVAELAPLLVALTSRPIDVASMSGDSSALEIEVQIAKGNDARRAGVMQLGRPSTYTCPDCHGVLLEVKDGGVPRFRCHTGHAYSIESLVSAVAEGIEDSMWAAVRALDEGGSLLQQLARHLQEHDDGAGATLLGRRGDDAKDRADRIRRLIADERGDRP